MPKTKSEKKTELVATRLTPKLKKAVENEARQEGMDVSEWVRYLIVTELRERDSIPRKLTLQDLEGEK